MTDVFSSLFQDFTSNLPTISKESFSPSGFWSWLGSSYKSEGGGCHNRHFTRAQSLQIDFEGPNQRKDRTFRSALSLQWGGGGGWTLLFGILFRFFYISRILKQALGSSPALFWLF